MCIRDRTFSAVRVLIAPYWNWNRYRPVSYTHLDVYKRQTHTIPSYHVHEILSENLRALLQRNRGEARNYYDIWYLKNNVTDIDWQEVKRGVVEKCEYKAIPFHDVNDFFKPERLKQVAITWEKRLSHQLTSTINMEDIMADIKEFLPKVFQWK